MFATSWKLVRVKSLTLVKNQNTKLFLFLQEGIGLQLWDILSNFHLVTSPFKTAFPDLLKNMVNGAISQNVHDNYMILIPF